MPETTESRRRSLNERLRFLRSRHRVATSAVPSAQPAPSRYDDRPIRTIQGGAAPVGDLFNPARHLPDSWAALSPMQGQTVSDTATSQPVLSGLSGNNVTVIVPAGPTRRILRGLVIRRDGSGPEAAQFNIKNGVRTVLSGLALGIHDSVSISGPLLIEVNEPLIIEAEGAHFFVDNVVIDPVLIPVPTPVPLKIPVPLGYDGEIPDPELLKPDAIETVIEGRMKAFLKSFEKEKE